MVLNVLIKIKTRIYAAPAVKGLTFTPLKTTIVVFNLFYQKVKSQLLYSGSETQLHVGGGGGVKMYIFLFTASGVEMK